MVVPAEIADATGPHGTSEPWGPVASALVLLPACDSADAGTNGTTTGGDVPEVF